MLGIEHNVLEEGMSQPVPQYWDLEEIMPDIGYLAEVYSGEVRDPVGEMWANRGFYAGAQAMWDRLKSEGSIKR